MRRGPALTAAVFLLTCMPPLALAHEGPPFPIVLDAPAGPYVAEVWTDPDIGTGTFFVILRAQDGRPFVEPSYVRVGVRPVSGRLPEALYDAESQEVRSGARYMAEVEFDRGEYWDVRVIVGGPAGGGELTSRVEATPDGSLGPVAVVFYTLPFLLVAFLWWRASVARRRMEEPRES